MYVYIRALCVGEDKELCFFHTLVEAASEDEAYAKGHKIVDAKAELHDLAFKNAVFADNDYVVKAW
jgi:hypothetical protein